MTRCLFAQLPQRAVALFLLAAFSSACATTGGVPRPFPGAPTSAPIASVGKPSTASEGASASATASASAHAPADKPADTTAGTADAPDLQSSRFDGRAVAEFALGFRGVPYRLGGADPAGFDCSGLVQYVFAQYGVPVPRIVEEQYEVGDKIKPSKIQPGDLIFFKTKRRGRDASHVAIAIGNDSFVHAPNSTGVVRVETLASSYWGSRFIGARRITPSSVSN
jgi:cell wall-associated NlpC family hydrolase